MVRTYSADSLEQIVMNAKDGLPPDLEFRVYCMGKNVEDFRVGHIHISPEGVAVVSGLDDAGNSIYTVSHFQLSTYANRLRNLEGSSQPDSR